MSNKTLEVFSQLSPQQMQRLGDFLASPYHNKNESLLELFQHLQKIHPAFPDEKITDAAILKSLKIKCSKGELHNKFTKLLRLAEDFLSFEYNRDEPLKKIGTLKAYKQLKLPAHFESLTAQIQKELDKELFRDFDYWWRAHRLQEELIEGFDNKIQRTADKTMAPVLDSLLHFYHVKKLRYMCDQANLKNQIGNCDADKFKNETLEFIAAADLTDTYLFAYSRIYLLFTEADEKKTDACYRELKNRVFDETNNFPPAELRSALAYMQIYCSQQANRGRQEFIRELFETIQLKIKKNILLETGQISPLLFKNTVTSAIRLGEYDWAEQFIRDFTAKLPAEFRADYSNYSSAQVHYFRGDYEKAMRLLNTVSHGKLDILLSFAVRKLLLRAEIESGQKEPVPEQIEAFKKHLQRKKKDLGGNAPLQHLFIHWFEKLFSATPAARKETISALQAAANFAEKGWLLQMAQRKKL